MAGRAVLILGADGQLGRKVGQVFTSRNWSTIGMDCVYNAPATTQVSIPIPAGTQFRHLEALQSQLGTQMSGKFSAIVNVAGGFAMGSAASPEVGERTMQMVESSIYSSIMAAHIASHALAPGGLLVLPGAAAACNPTPWSLPYGAAKAAVHHLVRSLADPAAAELPPEVKTVGIAPITLDTPGNREAMPDADHSAWASLEEVAEQLEAWCSNPASVESGMIYVVNKEPGQAASFEPRPPL
mmetsp:Transcript_25768/g.47097  ORF Transcript_25768/g.47097 Transcript_25768/m.47097 type:complete len:241 (-) Transcript_25768:53-775(-)